MSTIQPLHMIDPQRFETKAILKQLNIATRQLAELKGIASSIPNQSILINSLTLQEAKDSSAIENIVTTHDELFVNDSHRGQVGDANSKEVARYRQALNAGYREIRKHELLTNNTILQIHQALELNHGGFRKVPGTAIKNQLTGQTVHTPPSPEQLRDLMHDLERFINHESLSELDPLIKMALIHYQFECIHPFYDGNGRTGRIINVLYLVKMKLLNIPVLYLSRHIVRTRPEYYRLLQAVSEEDAWEAWVVYMLQAVEQVAADSIKTIRDIRHLMKTYKRDMRSKRSYGAYAQALLNNIFMHTYTRIDHLTQDMNISRPTATKYLDAMIADGFLIKIKRGTINYYINEKLYHILTGGPMNLPLP